MNQLRHCSIYLWAKQTVCITRTRHIRIHVNTTCLNHTILFGTYALKEHLSLTILESSSTIKTFIKNIHPPFLYQTIFVSWAKQQHPEHHYFFYLFSLPVLTGSALVCFQSRAYTSLTVWKHLESFSFLPKYKKKHSSARKSTLGVLKADKGIRLELWKQLPLHS